MSKVSLDREGQAFKDVCVSCGKIAEVGGYGNAMYEDGSERHVTVCVACLGPFLEEHGLMEETREIIKQETKEN